MVKPSTDITRRSWDGYLKEIVTSAKKLSPKIELKEGELLDKPLGLDSTSNMVIVVREILKKMKIQTATWQKSETQDYYQIMFSIVAGNNQRKLQTMLNEWGIGVREGSSVTIIPGTLLHTPYPTTSNNGTNTQEYI